MSAPERPWGVGIRLGGRRHQMENDDWSRRISELDSELVVVTETEPSGPDDTLPLLVPGRGSGLAFLEMRVVASPRD